MDTLIKQMAIYKAPTHVFTVWESVFCITLSFILNLAIAWTYRKTHNGVSYSQSFVHTMVMMGVIISVVMLVVGSNIARAFSLVGALSIVRFRNAVKETRDVGYIFFAMAAGMACGTRFYMLGIMFTVLVAVMMMLMDTFDFGAKQVTENLLRIDSPTDFDIEHFHKRFSKYLSSYALVSMELDVKQGSKSHVYLICEKRNKSKQDLMDEILKMNENNKVGIIYGQQKMDI